MVRDRLLGDWPSSEPLAAWLRDRWVEEPRSTSARPEGDDDSGHLRDGADVPTGSSRSRTEAKSDESTDGSRTAADGGSPPAWESDDPISFDEDDGDGQSLLDAVTADAEGPEIDLEAELRDAADGDTAPTPEELVEDAKRGESRRSESATPSPDDETNADLSWSEAVEQLIDEEADDEAAASDDGTARPSEPADSEGTGAQSRVRREPTESDTTGSDTANPPERTGGGRERRRFGDDTGAEESDHGGTDPSGSDGGPTDPSPSDDAAAGRKGTADGESDDAGERTSQSAGGERTDRSGGAVADDQGATDGEAVADDDRVPVDDEAAPDDDDRGSADDEATDNEVTDDEATDDIQQIADEDQGADGEGDDEAVTAQLNDRIEAIETEHEQVSTSVSSLETELDELRGDVDGIRSDLGTLVDLVKQAGHTRGGAAAAPATETTADSPAASEVDAPTPARHEESPERTETPDEQATTSKDSTTGARDLATESRDPTTEQSSTVASAPDQTNGATGSESETAERTDDVDGRAADGRETGGRATDRREADVESDDRSVDERRPEQARPDDGAARDVVDPRSDAVGSRLLEYRKQFGGGGPAASVAAVAAATSGAAGRDTATKLVDRESATESADGDDEPAAAGFQFQKLLVPADGDGEPELIGEDLRQPYLEDLPSGYAAEALVIEWLDGLVSQADQETAVQALGYYQSIGWIGASVRHTLVGYLSGLGEIDEDELPDAPPAALDMSDHRRTLEYVTHLATGEVSDDGI